MTPIILVGGFRRPADTMQRVPGDAGSLQEYLLPIKIFLGIMRGAVDNCEVYRRCTLPDGAVAFRYAGLLAPVDGVPLEEVYER